MDEDMPLSSNPELRDAIQAHSGAVIALNAASRAGGNQEGLNAVGKMLEAAKIESAERQRLLTVETKTRAEAQYRLLYFTAVLIVTHGTLREDEEERLLCELRKDVSRYT